METTWGAGFMCITTIYSTGRTKVVFAISIASFDGKEDHDTMTGFDRSALELRGIKCDYGAEDVVTISPYNKATGGTPESAPKHQINGVEFYGFKNASARHHPFKQNRHVRCQYTLFV